MATVPLAAEIETNDILYGALKLEQPLVGRGPRVSVDTVLLAHFARLGPRTRAIEMGTAHGAVALIAALRRRALWPDREMPTIDAFDINGDLVALASRNAEANGLASEVRAFTADLRDFRSIARAESYDAVIMNPPYDEPGRSRPSPDASLAAAMHGTECTLAEVARAAKYLLKNGGRFFCVMRAGRTSELLSTLESCGLRPKRMRAVHPKPDRAASSVLVESARSGGSGITIEPPLFICGEDGRYTSDLLRAYEIDGGDAPCR